MPIQPRRGGAPSGHVLQENPLYLVARYSSRIATFKEALKAFASLAPLERVPLSQLTQAEGGRMGAENIPGNRISAMLHKYSSAGASPRQPVEDACRSHQRQFPPAIASIGGAYQVRSARTTADAGVAHHHHLIFNHVFTLCFVPAHGAVC